MIIKTQKLNTQPRCRSSSSVTLIACLLLVIFGFEPQLKADDKPQKLLLAKRGKLIVDDDGSKDRGGKTIVKLNDEVGLKSALGTWTRSAPESNVWRSTWTPGTGHPPVVAYPGVVANNMIVEVTFRYGKATEPWHEQFLRIAADQRPKKKRHIVSAWANSKGHYTKTGMVLESVGEPDQKNENRGLLMDIQPINIKPEEWHTAVLEIVGDEALFRVGDQLAYAKADQISEPKNLVSLTLGTTWHEIKRVRIWHATANPEWQAKKDNVLKVREPFTARGR